MAMQSFQNFQPDGQGAPPMMGGLFTSGPNGVQYHRWAACLREMR